MFWIFTMPNYRPAVEFKISKPYWIFLLVACSQIFSYGSTQEATRNSSEPTCNFNGSKSAVLNEEGKCICKDNVIGDDCSVCEAKTFDLQYYHEAGCVKCFCFDVSEVCELESFPVTEIIDYVNYTLQLLKTQETVALNGIEVIASTDLSSIYFIDKEEVCFTLPTAFIGNKITSYGRNISLSLNYSSLSYTPDEASIRVLIINEEEGNLTWIKKFSKEVLFSSLKEIQIPLTEHALMKEVDSNVTRASRDDVMRILSSIKSIHIRAARTSYPASIHVSDIKMEVVHYSTSNTYFDVPIEDYSSAGVEVCDCPKAYTGSSCERCENGFYKSANAVCAECPCNGYKCRIDDGRLTCDCGDNFTGEYCEVAIKKPSILAGPANVTSGKRGSKLTLNCTIDNTFETHVSWEFKADSSEYIIKRFGCPQFEKLNCNLKISNLDVKDEGLYTCVAYNKMGNVSTSTYLSTYVKETKTETTLEVISLHCLRIATGVLSFLCILALIPIALLWFLSCGGKKLNSPSIDKPEEAEL